MKTNTANKNTNPITTKEVELMKTNITVAQIIASVNSQVVKSTAYFNEAFDTAESHWARELRTNVPFKERALYALSQEIKRSYNGASAEFVAEIAHKAVRSNDLVTFERELTHLVNWKNFCEAALHKTQRRMQMVNLHDLALFSLREGETWKTINDVEILLSTLEHEVTLNQLLISNSGSLAHHYMQPLLELEQAFNPAWERLTSSLVRKSLGRMKRRQGSKTDEIILGKSTMTTYMLPFVLNRFLADITKQEVNLAASIEFMEEKKAAAINETDGRAGEHRDRKVEGYSDLSRQEHGPKGYTNTSAVNTGQTASYYDDGNEELGIMGITQMNDLLQAMQVFEETILEMMDTLSAAFSDAEVEHPAKPTYAYKVHGEGDFEALTNKDEALAHLVAERKKFLEAKRKEKLITREDTARYDAMNMHVPTFNL
ncbi:hypothetical protein HC000_02070 [Pseudoalteromonas sp. MIP2626]|uniref:hypothetical protein n=1 Tax=Pseudoalteromonas sp. MIP2626 TaxID=2705464 RepID=UPI0015CC9F5C|nr:hypothetical protein [Pseudoalteromonas sp. MIP2626]NYR11286.1 hypothetical protein [Pseudoalteromonas sp. MIP2626]